MLPGNRIKVTGIALWNTKNEKYGPNIGELDFEADLKYDTVSWTDADGYRITIRFSRNALDVTERRSGRPLRDECDLRGALHADGGLNVMAKKPAIVTPQLPKELHPFVIPPEESS